LSDPASARGYALLERIFREEAGRLTASLVRLLGDFDLADDLVSDALVEALEHWPRHGIPERPASWLLTTARRKGLDRLRRETVYRKKLELIDSLPAEPPREADDRLRLIFTCCHPVLAREAQLALTLRTVAGLTTEEIARPSMIPEETLTKRITRAKHKIVASGVPHGVPAAEDMVERLDEVLTVIYLVFNEGYIATHGDEAIRRDLARDAEWLSSLLVQLMPEQAEPLGLLALIRLHLARWPSRLDECGRLLLLQHQDRSRWDRAAIAQAVTLIERAAALGRPGRYQVEAMIAALHCEATSWQTTDWPQIFALYSLLAAIDPSPVVALNRAIARSHVDGPAAALGDVEILRRELDEYHLFHATRAELLREIGHVAEASVEDAVALGLTRNTAERALLEERIIPGPSREAPASAKTP